MSNSQLSTKADQLQGVIAVTDNVKKTIITVIDVGKNFAKVVQKLTSQPKPN